MTARLTDVQKTRFQEAVKAAAEDVIDSVIHEDDHVASKQWRKQLGDRFPLVPKKENKGVTKQTAAGFAAVHKSHNPPKPWGWQ